METRTLAALRNLEVIDGGAKVGFDVMDDAAASQRYEMSIGVLNRVIMVLQDVCKNAIAELQKRPGFDEALYSVVRVGRIPDANNERPSGRSSHCRSNEIEHWACDRSSTSETASTSTCCSNRGAGQRS